MSTDGTKPESAATREPLATNVEYMIGLMGRPQPGMLVFDGVETVTLVSADGTEIFSKSIAALGKARRVEYAIYFKPDGKLITVTFGNPLKYVAQGGAMMQFGIVGLVLADRNAKGHTKASGMDEWEAALKGTGNLSFNASSGNIVKQTLKYAAIGIGLIIVVAVVVALL